MLEVKGDKGAVDGIAHINKYVEKEKIGKIDWHVIHPLVFSVGIGVQESY
ncbi:hypothetical protein GCM10010911_14950 [Paenibacillus nasutitermitis]|uniref:Uncharacterized protein n=1 Tax=Paenibacillus nasutitermitis TaxID=1652958 RepID=A0A916YS11_9BACL|nr:hypothetical protein GCM10010911_14950 [Paenibacillus nasutitermitis]